MSEFLFTREFIEQLAAIEKIAPKAGLETTLAPMPSWLAFVALRLRKNVLRVDAHAAR